MGLTLTLVPLTGPTPLSMLTLVAPLVAQRRVALIPGPALATCMTAVICVKIGNFYGVSNAAQPSAEQVISGLSSDRWLYYLNERLEEDRLILTELRHEKPAKRWVTMVGSLGLDQSKLTKKDAKFLVIASAQHDFSKVQKIAAAMLHKSLGV